MNLIHKQIINVVQFDKNTVTAHYKLQDGIAGYYKILNPTSDPQPAINIKLNECNKLLII